MHDGGPWKIQPHDGVRSLPYRAVDDHRSVVAVDHPAVGGGDLLDPGNELVRVDRLPVLQVMDGIEFDIGDVERLSDTCSEMGLARASAPDDRHPFHTPIIAETTLSLSAASTAAHHILESVGQWRRSRMERVHQDQISITRDQVAALIADEFPALAGLDVVPVDGGGTVNAIFRIGNRVAARFPLRNDDPDRVLAQLQRQRSAAGEFVLACPVAAPEPLNVGRPGHGYPLPWSTQTWLPGSPATPTECEDSTALAFELTDVVHHLRAWDTSGRRFHGTGRGGQLFDHDEWVDECITRSDGLLDTDVLRSMWSRFRKLPREDPDVMCHSDLIPSNLLVSDGHLAGLLDTGSFQAADPALDLVVAWHLFAEPARDQIRTGLDCNGLQWERGAAWAFQQAVGAYWYYRSSNQTMAEMGRTTLDRLVSTFA